MESKSDKKLKSIARKLEGLINSSNKQVIYDSLPPLFKSQKDYFENFDAPSLLKIVIYIYSIKKTGNTDLGDKIINNLKFACLLSTQNEYFEESCDECRGDGYISCYECDGTGTVECGECDGGGDITCETCDGGEMMDCQTCGGSGEDEEGESCTNCGGEGLEKCDDCDGKGITTCYNCAGDGSVDCRECSGSGSENCSYCDGRGEVETEQIMYTGTEICFWDNNLYDIFELRVNTDEPSIDEYDLDKFKNKITLNIYEGNDFLTGNLESDEYYCYELDNFSGIANSLEYDYGFRLFINRIPKYYIQ